MTETTPTAAELKEMERALEPFMGGCDRAFIRMAANAALAALRKQLDEARMQASGDRLILARALDQAGADAEHDDKVIAELRSANAQMAAALRAISVIRHRPDLHWTDQMAKEAERIADNALRALAQPAPVSQEAPALDPSAFEPGTDEWMDAVGLPASQEAPASPADDWNADKYQRAEERLCDCGAVGSGEGHTDWCKWLGSEWEKKGRALDTASPSPGLVLVPREPSYEQIAGLAQDWGYTVEEAAETYGTLIDRLAASPSPGLRAAERGTKSDDT